MVDEKAHGPSSLTDDGVAKVGEARSAVDNLYEHRELWS